MQSSNLLEGWGFVHEEKEKWGQNLTYHDSYSLHSHVLVAVEKNEQRLTKYAESEPERHVTKDRVSALAVDPLRDGNDGYLQEHSEECVERDDVARHGDEHFVQSCRNKEDKDLGRVGRVACAHRNAVCVADEPVVYGSVPEPPVNSKVTRVPPVSVEDSIAESQQLRD